MSKRAEIRVSGFGGQGVILCAHIMGKAASIFTDGQATMTQAFGPEARGSACSAQVVISDEVVAYPYVCACWASRPPASPRSWDARSS